MQQQHHKVDPNVRAMTATAYTITMSGQRDEKRHTTSSSEFLGPKQQQQSLVCLPHIANLNKHHESSGEVMMMPSQKTQSHQSIVMGNKSDATAAVDRTKATAAAIAAMRKSAPATSQLRKNFTTSSLFKLKSHFQQ